MDNDRDNSPGQTTLLGHCLKRLQAGDAAARDELLHHCCDRLRHLTQRMLRGFPGVRRWEQTDDVLQNVLLRLHRALAEVQPQAPREFLGLAATLIRRELLDLARHHYGRHGAGAHHASAAPTDSTGAPAHDPADDTNDPGRLAAWREFHETVAALPVEEREICDLLWYQGMTQPEAAALLGVGERTLKRRWQAIRLKLFELLKGQLP
jgi:RNA polymerase sigma factor (sigma-70 family)